MPRGIPNARPTQAKNSPVLSSKVLESGDAPLGHTVRTGNPNAATPQERIGEPELVQVAERMPDTEHMEMLRFLAEPITVRIGTSSDKNAEQVFEITINGRSELFRRGENKTVPRYYVDHMARMKATRYEDIERTNDQGEKYIEHRPYTTLKYDFSVVNDPNPLGRSWLEATLGMPG